MNRFWWLLELKHRGGGVGVLRGGNYLRAGGREGRSGRGYAADVVTQEVEPRFHSEEEQTEEDGGERGSPRARYRRGGKRRRRRLPGERVPGWGSGGLEPEGAGRGERGPRQPVRLRVRAARRHLRGQHRGQPRVYRELRSAGALLQMAGPPMHRGRSFSQVLLSLPPLSRLMIQPLVASTVPNPQPNPLW